MVLLEGSEMVAEGESTSGGLEAPSRRCESLTEPSTTVASSSTSTLMAIARHSFMQSL